VDPIAVAPFACFGRGMRAVEIAVRVMPARFEAREAGGGRRRRETGEGGEVHGSASAHRMQAPLLAANRANVKGVVGIAAAARPPFPPIRVYRLC